MKLRIINNIDEMNKKEMLEYFGGDYSFINLLNSAFLIVHYTYKKDILNDNNLNHLASFLCSQAHGDKFIIYGVAILVTNYYKRDDHIKKYENYNFRG